MDLPSSLFTSSIEEGNIYYFTTDQINTQVPHHFICIKKSDKVVLFNCCTSNPDSMYKFVTAKKLSEETIVTIPAFTKGTELTKHTYINCNEDPIEFTLEQFTDKFKALKVKSTGTIDAEYFSKILAGIRASDMIDEEMKEFIGC